MVAAGDRIEVEDSLVTLESDKASMEIPSPHAGVVKQVAVLGVEESSGPAGTEIDPTRVGQLDLDGLRTQGSQRRRQLPQTLGVGPVAAAHRQGVVVEPQEVATLDRCLAPCPRHGVPCTGCAGPSENVIMEPQRDIRTEVATRMSISLPAMRRRMRPSCGRRFSAMFSPAMTLMREMIGRASRRGGGAISYNAPSTR